MECHTELVSIRSVTPISDSALFSRLRTWKISIYRLKPARTASAAAHVALGTSVSIGVLPWQRDEERRDHVSALASLSRLSPVPVINKCSGTPRNKGCCVFVCVLLMFGWVVSLWLDWTPHKLSHGLNVWEFLSPLNPRNVLNSMLGKELCYNHPHKDLCSWSREPQKPNNSANKCSSRTKRSIM